MKTKQKNAIGLVLGSGGAKGLAHIGVLEVLEKTGVKVEYLSGSSMGAMIAVLYAHLGEVKLVKDIFIEDGVSTIARSLMDIAATGGLIKNTRIQEFLTKHLGNAKFEDLAIPVTVIATDLNTGEVVPISKGSLAKAVMASVSVLPLIQPIRYQGRLLTDGGLSDPLPVSAARKMGASKVIAVNLSNGYFKKNVSLSSKTGYMGQRAIALSQIRLAELMGQAADLVIKPKIDNQILFDLGGMFNNKIIRSYVKAGKVATDIEIRKIRKLIK